LKRQTRPYLRVENYKLAMQREISGVGFPTFFKNSAIIAGLAILGHLMSCTIVGYGFARLRAPGKQLLFTILLATMMLPYQVTLIPVYEIFRDLRMVDTLWPMFITAFFGNAFFIFLMRQFFRTIPLELEDAARIDGANRFQVFMRIMLPLTMPAQATIAIFTFLGCWNDLFGALIYLNSPKNYTVAIGLSAFRGQYTSEFNLLMAATVIIMLPTVLLFFFAQRFFIEGITLTGLKG
jgi:multiple sugar transport system permease protein